MLRGPTSTNDTNGVLVLLHPNDQDQPSSNRTDGNEAILEHRMLVVKDLQIVDARLKEFAGFFETDAVLSLVREILRMVPRDLHRDSVS